MKKATTTPAYVTLDARALSSVSRLVRDAAEQTAQRFTNAPEVRDVINKALWFLHDYGLYDAALYLSAHQRYDSGDKAALQNVKHHILQGLLDLTSQIVARKIADVTDIKRHVLEDDAVCFLLKQVWASYLVCVRHEMVVKEGRQVLACTRAPEQAQRYTPWT